MSKKTKKTNKDNKGTKDMAESQEELKKPQTEENVEQEELSTSEEEKTDPQADRIAELEGKVKELGETILKMKDDDLRRTADTENYKKRLRQDKENAVKYANEQLISDLLTPLDNFSRAIESADKTDDFEALKKGVFMVRDQLMSTLKSNWGLEAIDAEGKDFDPNLMEAYSVQEKENLEKETVLQEFAKGWKLNGKVLRTAKVLVGKPKK